MSPGHLAAAFAGLWLVLGWLPATASAQPVSSSGSEAVEHSGHGDQGTAGHEMTFDANGMVMNSNRDTLPRDCPAIAADYEFTVRVGAAYAADFPGTVYGMSQHEYRVEPCSRVTVTLVNEDQIRHQWMLHGLPLYLYPQGMFHLEAAAGQSRSGTFIVPGDHRTYLVHCDMTQHMEKGMKGQLVAGRGSGDLWSIPGLSREFRQPDQGRALDVALVASMAAMSFLVLVFLRGRQPGA